MSANINVTLNSTLSATDAVTNATIVARALSLLYPATTVFYEPFLQVPITPLTINLPAANVSVVVVTNKGLTNLSVTFTPNGSTSTTVTLEPGELFVYFQTGNPVSAGGITALSLTSASSTQPAEILLAA
jgi:hypothetical protein